jgi:hypothetical protein
VLISEAGKENLGDQQRFNRRDSNRKSGFLTAGVTKRRSNSAYPAVGPEVTIAGCKYLSVPKTDALLDGNPVTARLGLSIRFGSRSPCECLSATLLKKLRAYDRPHERGFIGRPMAAPGFDPETDVGASKDKGRPICWPHQVSPLAPASTATPPLRCSASVVLHCAPQ